MNIRVQYFALFREERGCSMEQLDTEAGTPAELYAELKAAHGFRLEAEQIRVAVGSAYVDMSHPLQDGDTLTLIPPVSGG